VRITWDFRLEGKAGWSSIGFNRGTGEGHLLALLLKPTGITVIAHPKEGGKFNPIEESQPLTLGAWHHATLEFRGEQLLINVDGKQYSASHPCVAETKFTLGLGGNSGGAEGESAGALEYRSLSITPLP
jgi:hypothetical protein